MKKYSASLTIKELQIKAHTSWNGHHQKNQRMINAVEGMEKKELSYTAGGM